MVVDIYKTYAGDFQFLRHSLRALRHKASGFRDVVIVTDPGELEVVREIVAESGLSSVRVFELPQSELDQARKLHRQAGAFVWVMRRSLLKRLHRLNLLKEPPLLRSAKTIRIGYEIQKAVKCDWTRWSDADAVLQLDSDMILTAELSVDSLMDQGRPFWFREAWDRKFRRDAGQVAADTWKSGTDWFYEISDSRHAYMCFPGFLLTRELTERFARHVRARCNGDFLELYLNRAYPNLSEYELLGYYADHFELEQPYCFKDAELDQSFRLPIRQFWSWGGFSDAVQDEIRTMEVGA